MNTILITGNTYPVKEQIKALGGRWNKAAQGWDVPSDRASEARALVDGVVQLLHTTITAILRIELHEVQLWR